MKEFAQVHLSIWSDDDFRTLSAPAQHLYFMLLSHPTATQCGVVDWRPKRLAALAAGLTAKEVENAASELVDGLFIIVDDDTEECLIRSYARANGIVRNANLTVAMVKDFHKVASSTIRGVIAFELARLRAEEPDFAGWGKGASDLADKPSLDPSELSPKHPPEDPPEDPSEDPSFSDGRGYERGYGRGYERGCRITSNKKPITGNKKQITLIDDHNLDEEPPLTIEPAAADHPDGRSSESTYPPAFEKWWELYPRKAGKGDALKAWRKTVKVTGGSDELLAATRARMPALRARETRFQPHPATWLRQARYDDPIQDEPTQKRGNAFLRLIDRNQATTDQEAINERQ